MDANELKKKVIELSEMFDPEGVAEALEITPEAVRDILAGKDVEIESKVQDHRPVIQVKTTTMVHRQKIIAVWRAKGGVGATTVAINLARVISEKMSVVLICLNAADAGSDMLYYLDMPYYPQKDLTIENVFQVQNNFYVMQPLTTAKSISPAEVRDLVLRARQEYDAVVLDLPNNQNESTIEAVQSANTLVLVMNHLRQQVQRVERIAAAFKNKTVIYVANSGKINAAALKKALPGIDDEQVIEIPFDKTLDEKLNSQLPLSTRAPFYAGCMEIYELIYKEKIAEEAAEGFKGNAAELFTKTRKSRKKIRKGIASAGKAVGSVFDALGPVVYVLGTVIILAIVVTSYAGIKIPYVDAIINKLVSAFKG